MALAMTEELSNRWHFENGGGRQTPVLRPKLVPRHKHSSDYAGSMYLSKFTRVHLLRERIELSLRALKPWKSYFDTIAFSGMSGALIGPPVAIALGKEMVMVRKQVRGQRQSHSSHVIEGNVGIINYIILDDFIDSGRTRDYIRTTLEARVPEANYLGLLQVNHLDDITLKDFERRRVPYPLTQ